MLNGKNMYRLLALFLLLSNWLSAQEAGQTRLQFIPLLNGKALALSQEEAGAAASAVKVEKLRFYLSEIRLLHEGVVVFAEANSHHLLDAEQPESLVIPLHLPEELSYDELVFTLGVDSLTSAGGAYGGDLDPTLGMYWTWRSGYIHFKIEGTSLECPGRNHRYQFHLGGYQAPFNAIREARLGIEPGAEFAIKLDLDQFFQVIDLQTQHRVMSPNAGAMELADLVTRLFYVEK